MNLVNLGDERLEKMGDIPAYVFEGEEYTSYRLNDMGRRLASGLKSLGIGRGDHVVVSMPNAPEVFACFGAIWRIGAVIVPIMFLLGENETRYILAHSDTQATIKAITPIEDFNEHFGCQFSDEEFDTIGGLVINALGHMPKRGETVMLGEFHFKVLRASSRRIHLLEVNKLDQEQIDKNKNDQTTEQVDEA